MRLTPEEEKKFKRKQEERYRRQLEEGQNIRKLRRKESNGQLDRQSLTAGLDFSGVKVRMIRTQLKRQGPKAWMVFVDCCHSQKEYETEVQLRDEQWLISRRFSQYAAVHSKVSHPVWLTRQLKRLHCSLPVLPPKRFIGNLNPDFVEERRKELEKYLLALTLVPQVLNSNEFKSFLV